MFDLSKFFSQLYLEICQGKIDVSLYKHLKMVLERKKAEINGSTSFPPFFIMQNQIMIFFL